MSAEKQIEDFKNTISRVMPELASPDKIAGLIELTGADYVSSLVAYADGISGYSDNEDISVKKPGLYTADLAYLKTFRQQEQKGTTFMACQTLANNQGIGNACLTRLRIYYQEMADDRNLWSSILKRKQE